MIPPYPMQFTLWGSTLWAELGAGLWWALATPWLEPLRPAPGESPPDPAGVAPRSATCTRIASGCHVGEPASSQPSMGRVIEVPPARWRDRRARGTDSSRDQ